MSKRPRSFSIDESIDEELSEREDVNPSPAVNKFLHEYLRGGRGPEAAYKARVDDLNREIAELEQETEAKKRERDKFQQLVERHRETLEDVLDDAEQQIEDGWDPENITVSNDAVQRFAAEAGVPAERFVRELEARLS